MPHQYRYQSFARMEHDPQEHTFNTAATEEGLPVDDPRAHP